MSLQLAGPRLDRELALSGMKTGIYIALETRVIYKIALIIDSLN